MKVLEKIKRGTVEVHWILISILKHGTKPLVGLQLLDEIVDTETTVS